MKIIELLVRASKDEKMPRKIKFNKAIWEYNEYSGDYIHQGCCLFKDLFEYKRVYDFINDEVEIIEENKKIEKIKILTDEYNMKYVAGDENKILSYSGVDLIFADRINRLIDEINKMKEGK